jgi:hypothetical protein
VNKVILLILITGDIIHFAMSSTFSSSIRSCKSLPIRIKDFFIYTTGTSTDGQLCILDKVSATLAIIDSVSYSAHLKQAGFGHIDPVAYIDVLYKAISTGLIHMTADRLFLIEYVIEPGMILIGSYKTVNVGALAADAISIGLESVIAIKASVEEDLTKSRILLQTEIITNSSKALNQETKLVKSSILIKPNTKLLHPLIKRRPIGGGIKIV